MIRMRRPAVDGGIGSFSTSLRTFRLWLRTLEDLVGLVRLKVVCKA